MITLFTAPEPIPMERYDLYLQRLVQSFQDWVNATVTLDVARCVAAAPDGLAPMPATPALVASTLDEAEILADQHRRPVFYVTLTGRPITIYPKGAKPEGWPG